jgi:DNA modification methylase
MAKFQDGKNQSEYSFIRRQPSAAFKELLALTGQPKKVNRPFTGDITSGKNNTVYRTHSYHTKVPHQAIIPLIEYYTEPGALVLDPFCGSGMTGLASILSCRNAILSDISPAAIHIAQNYSSPCDPVALLAAFKRLEVEVAPDVQALYTVTEGRSSYLTEYTVWSDVFACPECTTEFRYWDVARHAQTGDVANSVRCPGCKDYFEKKELKWVDEVPVESNLRPKDGSKRFTREVAKSELKQIDAVDSLRPRLWTPDVPFSRDREMWRMGHETAGIRSVRDFFTKRNLIALALIRQAILSEGNARVRQALLFAFTGCVNRASKRYQWNAKRPTNVMSGTLYVSSLRYEWNVWSLFSRKFADALRYYQFLGKPTGRCEVLQSSAANLGSIPDRSIDYVYMDPPFGSNIFYADCSLLWESWLGELTDLELEMVVNKHLRSKGNGKNLIDYQGLIANAFGEVRRVLKPNAHATLVFNNTDDTVWRAIQESLDQAGFEVYATSSLDKMQPSIKGIKGKQGEAVASFDAVITLRPCKKRAPKIPTLTVPEIEKKVITEMQKLVEMQFRKAGATTDELYSRVVRSFLEQGISLTGISMDRINQLCSSNLRPVKGRWLPQNT